MSSILLLTDLSDASLNAAAYGVRLFGREGNRFTLLHSYMVPVEADPLMMNAAPEMEEVETESIHAFADKLRQHLSMPDLPLEPEMVVGTLPGAIGILNKDQTFDAVVMGAGSTTGADEWLFGSDVGGVIKGVRVPVIVVPERATFAGVKHVLLANDGGDLVPSAFQLLLDLSHRDQGKVTVVRVEDPATPSTSVNPDPVFHALFGDLPHTFLTVQGKEIAETIDREAVANSADMVALLHRHLAPVQSWFHRSTAKQLALHTHVPLLVLHQ
ncbi:MAG: universal stress protein [Flavobacteriales bacterium]